MQAQHIIFDSITDEWIPHHVFERDHDRLFFKVIDNTTVGGTYTFFYDSPEQYESHRNFKLNPEITKKWYIRHEHLKKLLCIQEDEYNARKSVQVK